MIPEFPENDNAVCDGLYCGGPFTESVAFLVLLVMAVVAVIGLGLAVLRSIKEEETE